MHLGVGKEGQEVSGVAYAGRGGTCYLSYADGTSVDLV